MVFSGGGINHTARGGGSGGGKRAMQMMHPARAKSNQSITSAITHRRRWASLPAAIVCVGRD